MYRSHDHPQGAYIVPSVKVLNYNFSKEQYMLPEDDRVIDTFSECFKL